MDIVQNIRVIIEKTITDNGYILDEVLYVKESGINFLRIIIDKKGYIDLEDCVTVSKLIDPILDESNIVTDDYILDVCSKEKGSKNDGY